MLAKKYRLPIQTVLNKSGRSLKSRCFLFKFFLNKSRSPRLAGSGQVNFNRFGVIIGKKIDKRAAERNRLKRIIFDSVKKFVCPGRNRAGQSTDAEKKENFDVLIIVSQNMTKLPKADIIKELDDSLSKLFKNSKF